MRHVPLLLAALATLLPAGAVAQQDALDPGGLVGLSLPLGARNVGQARTAVASMGEIEALPYNPAVAAGVGSGALAFSRFESAAEADFNSNYLAAGGVTGIGALAVQLVLLDYGEIPVTVDSPEETGRIDVSEWTVGLTYADRWRERLAYGATAKWYRSDLGGVEASGPVFDLGIVYAPRPSLPFDLAVAIRNLGPDLEFDPAGDAGFPSTPGTDLVEQRLPGRVRIGARYHPERFADLPSGTTVELAFDVESDLEELSTTSLHGGGAVTLGDLVVIRSGVLLLDNPFIEEGDGDRNVGGTLGAGVRYGGFRADVSRELSVSELGDETHFSVGYRF